MSLLRSARFPAVVLLLAAALGLVVANSPLGAAVDDAMHAYLGIPGFFELSVSHWIKDGLLAVFFFVVAVELQYELTSGQLNSARKAKAAEAERVSAERKKRREQEKVAAAERRKQRAEARAAEQTKTVALPPGRAEPDSPRAAPAAKRAAGAAPAMDQRSLFARCDALVPKGASDDYRERPARMDYCMANGGRP